MHLWDWCFIPGRGETSPDDYSEFVWGRDLVQRQMDAKWIAVLIRKVFLIKVSQPDSLQTFPRLELAPLNY